MEHRFSVVMSVYKNDDPSFFLRALESITVKQSRVPDEIVLVVDGPVGEALERVIAQSEKSLDFLTVLRLKENQGLGNALNLAVKHAKHELLARMDSDDVASPDRFATQLSLFEKDPLLDIAGGDISEFVGEEDNIVAYRKVPVTDEGIKDYMKVRCPFNHGTVMYKKSAVLAAGSYLDLFWNEDYYLWIRMMEKGCRMANTGSVLVNNRTGRDMYKRRGGKKYFKSEKFLQDYMRKRGIIPFSTYAMNLAKRWIVQVLLPPSVRGIVFRTLARK